MKTNDEATQIGFYFPARATFPTEMQSHAESSTAFLTAAEWKCAWEHRVCANTSLISDLHLKNDTRHNFLDFYSVQYLCIFYLFIF